jgi:hypothetical protein
MTNQDVYERFEVLEEEVAHCYFILHERFLANRALAKFWADAALDELQHSSILRFCREHGLITKFTITSDVADRVDQLLDTVKDAVARPGLNADEAFSAALLIESSELDETYEKLIRPLAQTHPLLYQAVEANLRLHHYNFAEAAAEFSKDRAFAAAFKTLARVDQRMFAKGVSQ